MRGAASELANTRSCLAGLNQTAPSGELEKRIASKGLRPRCAAYVIVAVWSVSVVVFGVVGRPK